MFFRISLKWNELRRRSNATTRALVWLGLACPCVCILKQRCHVACTFRTLHNSPLKSSAACFMRIVDTGKRKITLTHNPTQSTCCLFFVWGWGLRGNLVQYRMCCHGNCVWFNVYVCIYHIRICLAMVLDMRNIVCTLIWREISTWYSSACMFNVHHNHIQQNLVLVLRIVFICVHMCVCCFGVRMVDLVFFIQFSERVFAEWWACLICVSGCSIYIVHSHSMHETLTHSLLYTLRFADQFHVFRLCVYLDCVVNELLFSVEANRRKGKLKSDI